MPTEIQHGSVNEFLASGGSTATQAFLSANGNVAKFCRNMRARHCAEMRGLTPFTTDIHKVFDTAVGQVARDRLVIANDLIAKGLTFPIPDYMSKTVLTWQDESDAGKAYEGMSPGSRGQNDAPDYLPAFLPLYLTWSQFSMPLRDFLVATNNGLAVDTSMAQKCMRRVNEKIEERTISGASFKIGGFPTFGLINHPDSGTFTYGANLAWDDPTKTGADILDDVQGMGKVMRDNFHYGEGKILYIPSDYEGVMGNDYTSGYPKTISARLLELTWLSSIQVADQLPADRTILLDPVSDVAQLVVGAAPTVIPWSSADGFTNHWMVLGATVPRIRADYNGSSGVVIGNV